VIDSRTVLGLIPARGGSKALPRKNILPVLGRPLLAWSIEAARRSRCLDRVVVSSEDSAVIDAARACGCEIPFRRPDELASDTAPAIDVVLHALDCLPGFDVVVLLQPTSPLRTAADIDAACATLLAQHAPACVSVSLVQESPYWMYSLDDNETLRPVMPGAAESVRRQDLPAVYVLNGAIYVADTAWLRRTRRFVTEDTVGYVMPAERSLDIDTAADLEAFRRTVTGELDA
jgi:N-acylneuraminate cytidylyltransferase